MMSSIDNPFGVILVYPPKLPDKYFMKWLREKISENKIRLNFSFDDKSTNVTDFIKNEIDNWNNNSPVFISAQTGVGKNYFIREELLPKLIDKYHNEKNLILLLSNRIALTRQTKLNFAERLVKFTHNDEHLKKIQNFFTPDGVDNLYIDFDVITICSYHQMYSRKLLDSTKFKYIVCDECHFFTSDSTFNPDTDNMLNEIVSKGQTSTRIYMSATPETAFEPIIRKEYKVLEDLKEQMKNALENRNFRNTAYSLELLSASLGNLQAKQNILRDNASAWLAMQDIERWHLELNFYCMGRNYDYIKKIFSYKTVDKLAEIVASSNDKWIIFSNRNGRNIADELKNKDVEVLFLSRDTLKCPRACW